VTLSASSDTCVSISLQQNQGKTDGLHENRSDFKERQCQALDFNPTEDPRMKDCDERCCAVQQSHGSAALPWQGDPSGSAMAALQCSL
jgi:hypothetical protein